ncbi:hypothetical protein M1506_00565 [Patescibacteria group bacterium]|nr:hypothetical protein [Patescibacteria group bacterium]
MTFIVKILSAFILIAALMSLNGCFTLYPYKTTIVDVGRGEIIQKGGFPITFGGVKAINNSPYHVDFIESGKWGEEYYALNVPPGGSWFFYWDYDEYPSMLLTARLTGTGKTVSQSFTGGYGSYTPPPRSWTVYLDNYGNLGAYSR